MASSPAQKLYTPEILGLAVELANYPLGVEHDLTGEARSPTCGSQVEIGLDLDPYRNIETIGMKVSACAIGQASAALFAAHAKQMNKDGVAAGLDGVSRWLRGQETAPVAAWLAPLEPARPHSARHGAIILPWKAALNALSS